MVCQATSERSPETSSFLVWLFEKHTIIISLDLDWGSLLLLIDGLLGHHNWLLLNYLWLSLNNLHVFCLSGLNRLLAAHELATAH